MIVLIDAYNVLKQAHASVHITEAQRTHFIKVLGHFMKDRGHKGILVFDGGPFERVSREKKAGIYIVYSGSLETADDYIKRYMDEHADLDVLLVSSDRELRDAAGRKDIISIPAKEFSAILSDYNTTGIVESSHGKEIQKTTSKDDSELDALMISGSKHVPTKKDDVISKSSSRLSKGHKLSKKEKAKLKKIKKLT